MNVQNVGLALRDLLGKVDVALGELPSETHGEVSLVFIFYIYNIITSIRC